MTQARAVHHTSAIKPRMAIQDKFRWSFSTPLRKNSSTTRLNTIIELTSRTLSCNQKYKRICNGLDCKGLGLRNKMCGVLGQAHADMSSLRMAACWPPSTTPRPLEKI